MDTTDTLAEEEMLAIKGWVSNEARSGAHIDEILPVLSRDKWASATLFAFSELRRKGSSGSFRLVACFPLRSSDELDVRPAQWSDLTSDVDEPPSLHLVDQVAALGTEDCEEYRHPMDGPPLNECIAYYRCFRPHLGIDNDWEYTRAIYIEAVVCALK